MKKQLLFTMLAAGFMHLNSHAQDNNTLQETGNVGIGTTTPETKLDVRGKVKIDSALIVKDSVTFQKSLRVEEDVHLLGTTTMNNVNVYGNFISGTSNVLGGTVSFPNLDVSTNLAGKTVVMTDATGLAQKVPFDTVGMMLRSLIYGSPVQVDFYCTQIAPTAPTWMNGPYKLFSRCPEVKVGIGTPDPRVSLDVRGRAYVNQLAVNSDPLAMGNKLFHLKAGYTHPSQSAEVLFLVENHERALFQISNNGIARSREVIVNTSQAWPDYVFSPGYRLAPLSEVAAFIKQNGHLPNVPNAAQVEADGIQLGEMNRILLEKVEELTLHLIEQQQQIEAQQQRIEALEHQK